MPAILWACAALLLSACASHPAEPHSDLARVWRHYLALPHERAMAIAGDPLRDRWVSGASGGHASREDAQRDALAECKRRRALRRMLAPCGIYAIGDEIVWAGPQ